MRKTLLHDDEFEAIRLRVEAGDLRSADALALVAEVRNRARLMEKFTTSVRYYRGRLASAERAIRRVYRQAHNDFIRGSKGIEA